MRRLGELPLLCVWGSEETDSLCPSPDPSRATLQRLASAHHFGGDYRGIAEAVLKMALPTNPPPM